MHILSTIIWARVIGKYVNIIFMIRSIASVRSSQVVLVAKNSPANARGIRDLRGVEFLGQEDPLGHGNPLQYYCLENPTARGAWQATVHGVAKSPTQLKTQHAWTQPLYRDELFLKTSAIGQWQKKSYCKLQKRKFPLVILFVAHDNKLCKNSSGFESPGLGG